MSQSDVELPRHQARHPRFITGMDVRWMHYWPWQSWNECLGPITPGRVVQLVFDDPGRRADTSLAVMAELDRQACVVATLPPRSRAGAADDCRVLFVDAESYPRPRDGADQSHWDFHRALVFELIALASRRDVCVLLRQGLTRGDDPEHRVVRGMEFASQMVLLDRGDRVRVLKNRFGVLGRIT